MQFIWKIITNSILQFYQEMNEIDQTVIMKWTTFILVIINHFCIVFHSVIVSEHQTTWWECFWECSSTTDKHHEQSKIKVVLFRVIFGVCYQNQQNGCCQILNYWQNDDEYTQVIITWNSNGNSFLLRLNSQLIQQLVIMSEWTKLWRQSTVHLLFCSLK